jgi:hypothetical protein
LDVIDKATSMRRKAEKLALAVISAPTPADPRLPSAASATSGRPTEPAAPALLRTHRPTTL